VQLQWATYFDAADQAGQSRLWGGIHVAADDFTGRIVGSQCGQRVWTLAQSYLNGSITNAPVALTIRSLNGGAWEMRFNTVPGFFYTLQSTPSPDQAYTNEPPGPTQAFGSSVTLTNMSYDSSKFYRITRTLTR
jgi:hypothetical protein